MDILDNPTAATTFLSKMCPRSHHRPLFCPFNQLLMFFPADFHSAEPVPTDDATPPSAHLIFCRTAVHNNHLLTFTIGAIHP